MQESLATLQPLPESEPAGKWENSNRNPNIPLIFLFHACRN
jgi:hypothetical protein